MSIRLVLTDIDGVWTDGGMYYGSDGEEWKKFNTADSEGVLYCRAAEIELAVLTGEDHPIVSRRAAKLGIQNLHMGVRDKLAVADRLREDLGLDWEEVAFIGDGLRDVTLMERAGFSATVPEAPDYVLKRADYVTAVPGGSGAFRDFVAQILRRENRLESIREGLIRDPDRGTD